MRNVLWVLLGAAVNSTLLAAPSSADARTVYRCVKDGQVSLANRPEPGSRCTAKTFPDGPTTPAEQMMAGRSGSIYRLERNGEVILSTRQLPGATKVMSFTVRSAPESSPARPGLPPAQVGRPRLDAYPHLFASAARTHRVDEAWLRAVAHVESAFVARALSPKGAQGIMQLMPATATQYRVKDPFDPQQSINAGAQHLAYLLRRYNGDFTLAAAAYNAGEGAVARHGGVPPYRETLAYVSKVQALKERYQAALGASPDR